MEGLLYNYHKEKNLVAFESGPSNATDCIVVIAGLTEGILSLPFVPLLSEALGKDGWCTVQVLLSSSYTGFGISTIQQDAEELTRLLEYLGGARGKKRIILLGHSTGCMDVLKYLQYYYRPEHHVLATILQGAVSDRDYLMASYPKWRETLEWAEREYSKGKPETIYGAGLFKNIPITARRIISLLAEGGDEDYFSVYMSDDERKRKLAGVPVPTFIALSDEDEFVPDRLMAYQKLISSLENCNVKVKVLDFIPGADHAISSPAAQEYFIVMIKDILHSL